MNNKYIKHLLNTIFSGHKFLYGHYFVHTSDANRFSDIISVMQNDFAWHKLSDKNQRHVECLIVDDECVSAESIASTLSDYMYPAFLFIYFPDGIKSAILFSACESHEYRCFRQEGRLAFFYRNKDTGCCFSGKFTLGMSEIQEQVRPSLRYLRKLPSETSVEQVWLAGADLLTPKRFDIAIKCLYGRLLMLNLGATWRERLYLEHITKITGAGWDITEHDGSGKVGLEAFLENFHSLLTTQPEDIPAVPMDRELTIFDGAHRVAAAIAARRPVRGVRINALSGALAPYTFFSNAGLSEDLLDEAALEYCRVKRGLVIALIFPTVANDAYAVEGLRDLGEIVYRKQVILSPQAGGRLLRQVYSGHEWFENLDEDAGFLNKQHSCFPFAGPLRIILLDNVNPARLRPVKDHIRSKLKLGNHSLHITDSDEETLRVSRLAFNHNSLEILECAAVPLPLFHKKLSIYRNWLHEHGLDTELFCLGGSTVLSLLGLRECRDIDFLYAGNVAALPVLPEGIGCHNESLQHYAHGIDDIIGDPRLHCWYMGLKFCSPQVVLRMKEQRGEAKDKVDTILLRDCLAGRGFALPVQWKEKSYLVYAAFRAHLARALKLAKTPLKPIVDAVRGQKKK